MIPEMKSKGVAMVPADVPQQFTIDPGTVSTPFAAFEIQDSTGATPTEVSTSRKFGPMLLDRRDPMITLADEYKLRADANPDSSLAWLQAGQAYLAAKDTHSARDCFEKAMALAPTNRNAMLGLARTAHEEGRADEALGVLDRLLLVDPSDTDALVSKAVVLAGTGKLRDALAMVSGDVPTTSTRATFLATRGSLLFATHEYTRALSDLRKVARLKPDWVHVRNLLGLTELRLGRTAVAERRFQEALRIGPLSREPLINLLRVFRQEGRWAELLGLVRKYWTPDPAPIEIAMLAANAALSLGDPRTAKDWLETARAKTRSPLELALLLNNLGVAYVHLDQLEEASNAFRVSAETVPSPEGIANRAKALMDQGLVSDALEWLLEWRHSPAFGTTAKVTLAYALALADQPQQAIELALPLIDDEKSDESPFALLSMLYTDMVGEPTVGAEIARRGLERLPGNAALLNNLAYSLLQAGRLDEAEESLRSVGSEAGLANTSRASIRATWGLLALKRGDIATGRRLYGEAVAISGYESMRARVKAKRDLEIARALIEGGGVTPEVLKLLERASLAKPSAEPYNSQAKSQLRLLRSGHR